MSPSVIFLLRAYCTVYKGWFQNIFCWLEMTIQTWYSREPLMEVVKGRGFLMSTLEDTEQSGFTVSTTSSAIVLKESYYPPR